MDIGIIGLGRMGASIAERLVRGGHRVLAFDLSAAAVAAATAKGAVAAGSAAALVAGLTPPRAVWLMLPAGEATETTLEVVAHALSAGDTVIDGGNSNYKDSVRRAASLKERGLSFVDAGTSGGVWGLNEGYSLMLGGEKETVDRLRPLFETLAPAPDRGWGHVGPAGAGHFVKMVHNGIEYGLMQAYAEGFELLRAKREFDLDLHQVAEVWRSGSVVRSWLLDLTAAALKDDPDLASVKGWVADSGEGRWTVAEAIDLDVPAPVITLSLLMRFASRQDQSYAAKLLAALRNQFGGHTLLTEDK
jgi:6-phosphogluconate dehydrogenase